MTVRKIGLVALACGGAFGFGVLANACIDLVSPANGHAAIKTPVAAAPQAAPAEAPAAPADTAQVQSVKVRTIPITVASANSFVVADSVSRPVALPQQAEPETAPVPTPRPSTAAAPAPAKPPRAHAAAAQEEAPLSAAYVERIKTALNLTPDQEALWPAVAAELRAIGKQQPKHADKSKPAKLTVDPDSAQRLYTAAAPLIMRLREDQKRTARQLALMLGLQEVAEAI